MKYFVVPVEFCDGVKDIVKPTKYGETLFALVTTEGNKLCYSIETAYYTEFWRSVTVHALFSVTGGAKSPDLENEVIQPLVKTCRSLDRLRIDGSAIAGWWSFWALSKRQAINRFVRRKYVNALHYRYCSTGIQVSNL